MKLRILFIFLFIAAYNIATPAQSVNRVESFGNNLQLWNETNDIGYRKEIGKMYRKTCIITRNVALLYSLLSFEEMKHTKDDSYYMEDFLNMLQKQYGSTSVHISEVKMVSSTEVDGKIESGFSLVVARIITSGRIQTSENELFYIDDKSNRIAKIDKYTKDGNDKIHVDFSDLEYDASLGATYNYSKHFPYGGSLIYSYRKFMCSLDLGFTTDGSEIITRKIDMKNIMNYTLTETTFKPKFFATITPSIFFKYFSVGCGVGVLYFSGKEDIQKKAFDEETMSEPSMTVTITQKTSFSIFGDDARKAKLMIRPNARGFVKLSDRWHLILSASYNYVFDYTELNGISFGMGLKYSFD